MEQYAVVVLGGLFTIFASQGFWTWFGGERYKKHIRNDSSTSMILALGRKELLKCCKKYKAEGYIPMDEYEAFDELFKSYASMGGNGTIKRLHEEVVKLPIEDK